MLNAVRTAVFIALAARWCVNCTLIDADGALIHPNDAPCAANAKCAEGAVRTVETAVRAHYERYPYPHWDVSERPSCRFTSDLLDVAHQAWNGQLSRAGRRDGLERRPFRAVSH